LILAVTTKNSFPSFGRASAQLRDWKTLKYTEYSLGFQSFICTKTLADKTKNIFCGASIIFA